MRDEDFKRWLQDRGCTPNGINTRLAYVRLAERNMAGLGSEFSDLDDAYNADRFEQLRQAFDGLRADAKAGGQRFRALFPATANARSRITELKNMVGQYAQFRSGATPNLKIELNHADKYWFVGASFGGSDDQVARFLDQGIWEVSTPKESERDAVRSMPVGGRIAIKAAFVQRLNLPFDNKDQNVSVMRIKARGTITANPGDGERVSVSWDDEFEPKDWYFYTSRHTIWEVHPGTELANKLIAFTFFDEPQDFDWFRNHGSWAALRGDKAGPAVQRYWIEKTIVAGRSDREEGEHALGRALWSPQRSKDGKNIYANMLQVAPGDVIFHLTDNEAITGVSIAGAVADTNFVGLKNSDWADQPSYRIELVDHEKLGPPLPRDAILDTEPFSTELRELAESGAKGLFYNSRRGLNQGAYLTEVTPTLLSILNRAYEAFAGKSLPYVASDGHSEVEAPLPPYTLDDALAGC